MVTLKHIATRPESPRLLLNVGPRVVAGAFAATTIFLLGWYTASRLSGGASASTPAQTSSKTLGSYLASKTESAERLASEKIVQWQQRLDATPPNAAREKDRLRMLSAWARVSPRASLEYIRKNLTRDRQAKALTVVFETWAGQNPAAAWDWVLTRENGDSGHLRSVLTEVAKNDSEMAQRFVSIYAQQHPDQASDAYLCALEGVMYAGNYEGAQRMIVEATVPNEEQRNILLNFLAGGWARYQPEKAASWAVLLPAGAIRDQAIDAVGQAWSDVDPPHAAEFAVNLPPGPERQTALKQAISKWTLDDPLRAGEWLLKYNAHGDFDQAVAAIATSSDVMNHNANLAIGWAGTIQQEDLRRKSTIAIVSIWYSNDPASALGYIKNSTDLSPETRQEILKSLPSSN
jgi:hypothetical protein